MGKSIHVIAKHKYIERIIFFALEMKRNSGLRRGMNKIVKLPFLCRAAESSLEMH